MTLIDILIGSVIGTVIGTIVMNKWAIPALDKWWEDRKQRKKADNVNTS